MTTATAEARLPFGRIVATCFLPFVAGYLLSNVFRTVNAVVGPRIGAELGLDAAAIGVLTSAYFAGFSLIQIPAGIGLDRWGPRRVQVVLLMIAALGALAFALAGGVASLAVARFLIGFGVGACLMSGFKANTLFWPREKLPLANGTLMSFAGIGASFGTLPVTFLADAIGWRMVFALLSALTLGAAALVWFAVPDRMGPREDWRAALGGVRRVFASRLFWRVVPVSAATHGAFQAWSALWAAPWLREVAGYAPGQADAAMFAILLAITPGYLLSGWAPGALARFGIGLERVVSLYALAFIALQVPLALGVTAFAPLWWIAYVMLGVGTAVAYVILTHAFPPALAGRVNTAINLSVFVVAFAAQAAVGYGLAWLEARWGVSRAAAHGWVLGAAIVVQLAAWGWFVAGRGSRRTG